MFQLRLGLRYIVFAAIIIACSRDNSGLTQPVGPPRFDIYAGGGQSGPVGQQLRNPLVVKVTDQHGHPEKGQVVTFHVIAGGGTLFSGAGASDKDGLVKELWTLGLSAKDSQVVEARYVDSKSGDPVTVGRFYATATADIPAKVVAIQPTGGTAPGVTRSDSLQFIVFDQFNNPVPHVTLDMTVGTNGGSVAPVHPVTDSGGIAHIQWTAGTVSGTDTVRASYSGLSARSIVHVAPPLPLRAQFTCPYVSRTVGETAPSTALPYVVVSDSTGARVPGVKVVFMALDSTTQLSGAAETTDAQGKATLGGWVYGEKADTSILVATFPSDSVVSADGSDSVTLRIILSPGLPAQLVKISGDSQVGVVNQMLDPVVVKVLDMYGNAVPLTQVDFVVDSGGVAPYPGDSTSEWGIDPGMGLQPVNDGTFAFKTWKLGPTPGVNTLKVRALSGADTVRTVFHATAIAETAINERRFRGIRSLPICGLSNTVLMTVASSRTKSNSEMFVTWVTTVFSDDHLGDSSLEKLVHRNK